MNWFLEMLKKFLESLRPAPVPPTPPTPTPPPAPSDGSMLSLHNAERAKRGLSPLAENRLLASAAQLHAEWMADNNTLSHDRGRERPGDRMTRAGYSWSRCAENIAAGNSSTDATFRQWVNSPGHHANIVGAYKDAGFGRALSDNGTAYWAANFASPRASWMKSAFTRWW